MRCCQQSLDSFGGFMGLKVALLSLVGSGAIFFLRTSYVGGSDSSVVSFSAAFRRVTARSVDIRTRFDGYRLAQHGEDREPLKRLHIVRVAHSFG